MTGRGGAAMMAGPAPTAGGIIPAQLGFLAIFNPSLGSTDETVDDQIVYYASVTTQSSRRRRRARARPTDDISQEERHERLRQIGLAQGMVNFGRAFSNGAPVDAIDTDKSRVIAHELEPGWWILASIELNKVPLPPRLPTKPGDKPEERYEYNSREMKPAQLLLRDLLRAHGIFLLHHDFSLSSLFARCRRSSFAALLSRYWDLFLSTWNVMLHGNPIRDVFGGINVAASGELGVGVGEEERGSGEREVLEGLVGRVEGLVDLVVSRFGEEDDPSSSSHDARRPARSEPEMWLGSGKEPSVEDGVIFLGNGALSRKSLADVAHWMEDLYTWGEHAYGVIQGSASNRRSHMKRMSRSVGQDGKQTPKDDAQASAAQPTQDTNTDDAQPPAKMPDQAEQVDPIAGERDAGSGGLDRMVSYLTLGYGSYWSLPGKGALTGGNSSPKPANIERVKSNHTHKRSGSHRSSTDMSNESAGHFLIGLQGEIEEDVLSDRESGVGSPDPEGSEGNPRTVLRSVHVTLDEAGGENGPEQMGVGKDTGHPTSPLVGTQHAGEDPHHHANKTEKLRVVVYVNRPFIFTFLFRRQTDSLSVDALYRSLHYQLAPLRKPLLASTKYRPERPDTGPAASSIYDIVWDPSSLTVHSTIPNIPDFHSPEPSSQTWSRADAVSTHINLVNIHAATRFRATDLERTQKTNRGWWIVWTRILQHALLPRQQQAESPNPNRRNLSVIHESSAAGSRNSFTDTSSLDSRRSRSPGIGLGIGASSGSGTCTGTGMAAVAVAGAGVGGGGSASSSSSSGKEIYLIRRASDHAGYLLAADEGAGGGGEGVGRLAQGIGIDTRRYVEELLSLL